MGVGEEGKQYPCQHLSSTSSLSELWLPFHGDRKLFSNFDQDAIDDLYNQILDNAKKFKLRGQNSGLGPVTLSNLRSTSVREFHFKSVRVLRTKSIERG